MPTPPVARRRIAIAYMPYVPDYSIYSYTQAIVCHILAVLHVLPGVRYEKPAKRLTRHTVKRKSGVVFHAQHTLVPH